ncbi:MAG: hypothetical protein EOP78_08300 [Variovorax sp.]|nr:MAG: hypothetical protein EOP78_08300 [Variovorax sp.]
MPIVVFLDPSQRWRWQLHDSDEVVVAEGCQTFATYAHAVGNAHEVCRRIPDAPVEVEVALAPVASTPRISAALSSAGQALRERGLEAALEVLNSRIPHRYTAVYWLPDPDRLVNVALVDKLREPAPLNLQTLPYNESFCQFAIRDGEFRTFNSARDARLDGHVYQGVLNSYHAVPLTSSSGEILGTLCHFDPVALDLADEDFELLRLFSKIVVPYLPRVAVSAVRDGGP